MRFTRKLKQLGMNTAGCGKDRARHHAIHRHVELAGEQDGHRRTDCRVLGGERGDSDSFPAQQMCDAMGGDVAAMHGRAGIGAEHLAGTVLGKLLRPPIDTDRLHTYSTIDDEPAMRGDIPLMGNRHLIREFLIL